MATVTSVTKHFPVPKEGFTTTTSGSIGSGAATVGLNSVTGYTNGDTAVFVIDPSDATKKQAFTGVIDTAGTQVTSVVWTEGTNTTHAAGATVVDYVAATHMAMVTKGLLRDHNPSGYHKTLNDDSGNEWLKQTSVASAVNEVTLSNNATGLPPKLTSTGNDTNIDMQIAGKGTGKAHVDGFSEVAFDFIISGGVWTGDAYASTKNASMTLVAAYINGQRLSSTTNSPGLAAVTARVFTASKDTYVDILNTSGVGTLVYTEVTNNAASPALAANSIRLGVVVTGATNIAAAGSINQGQEDRALPIVSSTAYSVTDSLGNLICPRDPNRKILGYRQNPNGFNLTASQTTATLVTGLSVPVIVPTGRKVKVSAYTYFLTGGANNTPAFELHDGSISGFTNQIQGADVGMAGTAVGGPANPSVILTPTSTSKTYLVSARNNALANVTVSASSSAPFRPAYIVVELV